MKENPLVIIEKSYDRSFKLIKDAAEKLESEFRSSGNDEEFVESKIASIFILTWMKKHFLFQKEFDALFGRRVMPSSADQFTAAVALTLDRYLSSQSLSHAVRSEVAIRKKRGALRPDITVGPNENELVAAIECKTNLGWNRSGWRKQYEDRAREIRRHHPKCESFLCILTKRNWNTSWEVFRSSKLAGRKWFCLSRVWPSKIENPAKVLLYPIEPLFISIRNVMAGDVA